MFTLSSLPRLVRPANSNSLASSNSSGSASTLLYRNNSSASHNSYRSVRSNATTLTALSSYTGTFSSGASATSARGESVERSVFGMYLVWMSCHLFVTGENKLFKTCTKDVRTEEREEGYPKSDGKGIF